MNLHSGYLLTAVLAAVCVFISSASAQTKSSNGTTSDDAQALEKQPSEQAPLDVLGLPPALPISLAAHAKSYKSFYADVSEINGSSLRTRDEIHAAINSLTGHDPIRLAEGWIAYAADIALNTPSFYSAFHQRMTRQGRDELLREISMKPGFVYALPESSAAVQLIVNMIAVETELMASLGQTFVVEANRPKRQEHAQRSSESLRGEILTWSRVPGYQHGPAPTDNGHALLLPAMSKKDAAASTLPMPTIDPSPNMPPVMKRILDLAGRIIIDASAGPEWDATKSLMSNSRMARCLKWADLNMKQCTAAAEGPSELFYCAGNHALTERADCWRTLITVGNGT